MTSRVALRMRNRIYEPEYLVSRLRGLWGSECFNRSHGNSRVMARLGPGLGPGLGPATRDFILLPAAKSWVARHDTGDCDPAAVDSVVSPQALG